MSTLIRAATVVDGTERPRYRADVLVDGPRIAAILTAGGAAPAADRVLDADGLVLAPGFIDMHAHSDLQILLQPDHLAKISQGVTTELLGQDGLSYAPVDDDALAMLRKKIAGWNGDPADFDFSWRTVGEYLDRLDAAASPATRPTWSRTAWSGRWSAAGRTCRRAPTTSWRCRRSCAPRWPRGPSACRPGSPTPPACTPTTPSCSPCAATVGELGGFYAPHHRSYGKGALDAYAEMIDLTTRAGCPLHLSHATMNFAPNKGRAGELLAMLDAAIADGADITLDTYPYLPGATTLVGGAAELVVRGRAGRDAGPAARPRGARAGSATTWRSTAPTAATAWSPSGTPSRSAGSPTPSSTGWSGAPSRRSPPTPGASRSRCSSTCSCATTLGTGILQHVGHEENVQAIMRHPRHTGGSDGLLVGAKPHPRAWGTFPRYLGHYCRDLGVFSLEECVGHLTGRAAARLRLRDRGLVRTGYAADLVLFDPATVADAATYADPRQPAVGIPYVFVNGELAMDDGKRTGALAGRALRRLPDGAVA